MSPCLVSIDADEWCVRPIELAHRESLRNGSADYTIGEQVNKFPVRMIRPILPVPGSIGGDAWGLSSAL
jgi:hypothetical protein